MLLSSAQPIKIGGKGDTVLLQGLKLLKFEEEKFFKEIKLFC